MTNIKSSSKKHVLIFDMNETLLDLEKVKVSVSNILGGQEAVSQWFETLLHYSLVDTVTGQYHNFGEIGVAALLMVATKRDVELTEQAARKALEPIRWARPFPEVPDSLGKMQTANYRMAILTNSSCEGMQAQLNNADIARYFELCLSVEDIGKYKPLSEVYHWAAQRLDVEPKKCLFIAAHGWDVAGAKAAGMQTAFLARPGHALYPLSPKPDFIEKNLANLSEALILNY